jgi:NADPH-dependent 2,4-dienoyl-CoA reductase/sulfur reductase-like enzyme
MSALISTLSVMEAADGAGGGDSRSGGRQPSETEPVIIVGGGLAGLVAALEAVRNGAFVVIIDGEKDVGGNSAKASSGRSVCLWGCFGTKMGPSCIVLCSCCFLPPLRPPFLSQLLKVNG